MPAVEKDELEHLGSPVQEAQELTLQQIWQEVTTNDDIVIIIDKVEESRVRKGLSSIKAKENAKLKDNGLPIDRSTLEFAVHKDDSIPKDRVKLQIYLQRPPTVKVHTLVVSDPEL